MNYCGHSDPQNFFKKLLSARFNYLRKLHNERYNSKEYTRKLIDKVFLDDMLMYSKNRRDKFFAYTYYFAVRVFGWISW